MMTARNSADRNRRRDDQRAAQIAEEHPLDQEDQRDAEQHVVQHGADRDRDQIAAVVERLDLHAGRQAAVGVDALDRRAHALTTSMVRSSFCISTMPKTMSVLSSRAGNAEPRREADLDLGDIGQQHRHAALLASARCCRCPRASRARRGRAH